MVLKKDFHIILMFNRGWKPVLYTIAFLTLMFMNYLRVL